MREIPQFTRDDYLQGTEPFEYLYSLKDSKFELKQVLNVMSESAKAVGIRNLAAMFKAYVESVTSQSSITDGNSTDFTGQSLELQCGSWEATDMGIYGTDKFGFEIIACYHPIIPTQRLVNVDTNIHKVALSFCLGRRWSSVIEDRKTISDSRSIIKLSDYGIMVNSENAKHLVRYLAEIEQMNYDRIPEISSVGRLGWIDGYGFSPFEDNLVFDGDEEYRSRFEAIRGKGDYQAWLDCVKAVRAGKTPGNVIARIVLAASFASVLVRPCTCLPFFVHLWGGSETGKSLSLVMAASVWGDCEIGKYIQTFNATDVGKELGAAFCNSMPLIIDELQMIKDGRKDFDKMIYQLSEGVGRQRGKKGGGIQRTPTWRNCIITTGEFPIISANSGAGAVNRTLEVDCHEKKLFDDPKSVAVILYSNYGFAGRAFIEKLQIGDNMQEAINLQNKMQEKIKSADTMDKQTASAALILAADELTERWIFQDGVRLRPADVTPYLVSKEMVNQNSRALQFLYDSVNINREKFIYNGAGGAGELWGAIDEKYIYIIKSKFDQILQDEGYNPTAFLGWAKNQGVLKLGPNESFTKVKKLKGNSARCVWIETETAWATGDCEDLEPLLADIP